MMIADDLAPNRELTISNPHADLIVTMKRQTIHITQHTYRVTVITQTVREKSGGRQTRWVLGCWWVTLYDKNGLAQRPTSERQSHGYSTMDMSPDGRYWYHYSGILSYKPLPRVWKWHLQTPDLVVIYRHIWPDQYGRVPSWLAQ